MRIAVLQPNRGFLTGGRSMHRYVEEFLNRYTDKVVTHEEAKTYDGDAIVCFNGRPDLGWNFIPKQFKGLKVVHLMDHVFQTDRTRKVLLENGVQYVMCYNRADHYDAFFKKAYPEYLGKVIPVPFGFNDRRFKNIKPFGERKNKVVAMGSVNPVSDPHCLVDIQAYATFYKEYEFTHKWRRVLCEERNQLLKEMDSMLPVFPTTKDFKYNIVEKYNEYQMFTTCESIMNYPSVKTFEGMACGSVFVGNDVECYKELGLKHRVNCLLHKPNSIPDFQYMIKWAQDNPEELANIAMAGQKFVEDNYTPEKVATYLYNQFEKCLKSL